jgi:hypothetical protein
MTAAAARAEMLRAMRRGVLEAMVASASILSSRSGVEERPRWFGRGELRSDVPRTFYCKGRAGKTSGGAGEQGEGDGGENEWGQRLTSSESVETCGGGSAAPAAKFSGLEERIGTGRGGK